MKIQGDFSDLVDAYLTTKNNRGVQAMVVPRSMEAGEGYILYLSPVLVQKPDEEIRFTIAHEIAHIVLGHQECLSADAHAEAESGEREADDLAQSWGFVRSEKFNRF